jgi:hypothetical protein
MSLTLAQFTSGSVAGFAGGSGLLETLLAFVLGTEVTAAATSGSGVGPYTASLSTPVGLGRTVLKYTISSVDYEAQDDGTGNFTGTQISSASVNHSTGAFTVTFGTTPDSAPTLDYLYGNPGQDWRLMVKQNTKDDTIPTPAEPFGSAMKECILHNTGLSGAENVLIGFREWQYPASNAYGWDLTGYLSYTSGMLWQESLDDMAQDTYSGTWEHWSACPMLPLADDTMYYWFNSNQQRITGAVKISSNYESFYLGLETDMETLKTIQIHCSFVVQQLVTNLIQIPFQQHMHLFQQQVVVENTILSCLTIHGLCNGEQVLDNCRLFFIHCINGQMQGHCINHLQRKKIFFHL